MTLWRAIECRGVLGTEPGMPGYWCVQLQVKDMLYGRLTVCVGRTNQLMDSDKVRDLLCGNNLLTIPFLAANPEQGMGRCQAALGWCVSSPSRMSRRLTDLFELRFASSLHVTRGRSPPGGATRQPACNELTRDARLHLCLVLTVHQLPQLFKAGSICIIQSALFVSPVCWQLDAVRQAIRVLIESSQALRMHTLAYRHYVLIQI